MSLLISLLAGASCKLYDDLNDNSLLYKFKNNFIMEFLKGIHFITFSSISIDDPLFFIIWYIANIFNYLGNNDAWESDYEKSLFYSFLLLFLIIDYTKISSNYSIYDILTMSCTVIILGIERIIMQYVVKNNEEVSYEKLILRTLSIIFNLLFNYFCIENKTSQNIIFYSIGYLSVNVLIQYYSLTLIQDKKIDEDKKDEDKKDEDKKDEDKKDEDKKDEDKKDEDKKDEDKKDEE
jgi:hypothetical protein